MDVSRKSLLRQPANLQVHEADDGLIAFDPDNDRVHHLNPSAGVMFSLCDNPQTKGQLTEQFIIAYGLDADEHAQAEEAIAQLLREGLLVASTD
ncbi:MAG: PqqD family protein [Congregibacter sp.]